MSNGKAVTQKTLADALLKIQKEQKKMFGNLRQSGSSPAQPDVGPNSGGNQFTPPTNSFLPVAGGSMKGPFGLVHQVCAIVASALNISDPTVNTSYVVINAGGPNLQAISSVSSVDPILILYNGSGGDITLKQAVGPGMNIDTVTQADMVFKNLSHSIFIYNHNPGIWHQITSTTTTGANTALSNLTSPTAINQDLICGDGVSASQRHNIVNLNILDFGVGSGSSAGNHPYIVGNGTNHQFNIGAHATDIITLTNAFNSGSGIPDNGVLQLFGTSHGVHSGVLWIPSIKTVNTSSVISSGDFIGGYYFDAFNSAFTQKTFASVFAKADVITSGSERGSLRFNILIGTTLTEEMFIDQGGINMNSVAILASGLEIDGGNILLNDGVNIFTGTSTGTKIGFSTSEKIGFWGKTPVIRQTVTGSRGGNAALQSLLSALNTAGIVTDASSA